LSQARQDFLQVRDLILRDHPLNFAPRNEIAKAFDSQYSALEDGLTIMEFYRVIAPAISAVSCGHTRLSLPGCIHEDVFTNGHSLPFDIKVTHDSLVIVETYVPDHAIRRGSVILSINGRPAGKIISRIKSCLYADGYNETFKYFLMNQNFARRYLEMVEDTAFFEIDLVNPGTGERGSFTVGALSLQGIKERRAAMSVDGSNHRLIETAIDSTSTHAVLTIRFFGFYDNLDGFTEPIDSFFQSLTRRNVRSLILDMRGNDGGDPYSSAYLLGYLIGKPFGYFAPQSTFLYDDLKHLQDVPDIPFQGNLYVLVDGGCYSTTGHFLSILRTHGEGLFIGEETGGSYVCNGGYKEYRLSHTGIELLLPHTAFIAAASGLEKGRGINPDVFVDYSVSDLINDNDPVLKTAMTIIRGHN
jgi:hypothetical protein